MATLKQYFDLDFPTALAFGFNWQTNDQLDLNVKIGVETYSNAKFIAYFVPNHPQSFSICCALINNIDAALKQSLGVQTAMSLPGEINLGLIGSLHSVFSNRIYLYLEDDISTDSLNLLNAMCIEKSLSLTIRGNEYTNFRMKSETPLAFISHDSRDKAEIAIHIALELQKLLCPVWYDEFSLKVGDHLRESIEHGLKETPKCILILSKNFLSNTGWTKMEFNSIFTRELLEKKSVVLPVWHNVTPQEVYEYSPSLADRVALDWSKLGKEEVIRRIYNAIKT